MSRRKTRDEFIKEAIAIHGGRYNYSLVEYIGGKANIKIICSIHGIFNQSPNNHLKGKGCFKCADTRKTTQVFIKEARSIHGDKYDYSLVDYIQSKKHIDILCKIHGVFSQTPANHIKGRGCSKCGYKKISNTNRKYKEGDIKPCPKCHKELPLTNEFYFKNNQVANGFSSYCKECENERNKKNHKENPEVYKASFKKSRVKRKDIIYKNFKRRRETDIAFKIRCDMSARINDAVKNAGVRKCKSTIDLVGCSAVDLVKYLESLFTEGMSWKNYGYYGWHIDHIRPCASFDLSDSEQQKQCFYYTNLQPLWANENFKKNALYNGVDCRRKAC